MSPLTTYVLDGHGVLRLLKLRRIFSLTRNTYGPMSAKCSQIQGEVVIDFSGNLMM